MTRAIAITGLGVNYGGGDNLTAFEQALYSGTLTQEAATTATEKLAYRVAREALNTANRKTAGNAALLVVDGDRAIAEKLATRLGISGGVQLFGAGGESVLQALATAQELLHSGKAEAVVLVVATGAAVTLELYRSGKPVYALLHALSQDTTTKPSTQTISQLANQALSEAGLSSAEPGYLEVIGTAKAEVTAGLIQAYAANNGALGGVIPSATALNMLVSLIKTTLCLYHRYIPGLHNWSGWEEWQNSHFYVADRSRFWFLEKGQTRRHAALSFNGQNCAHLILSEEPNRKSAPVRFMDAQHNTLFLLAANDLPGIMNRLSGLKRQLQEGLSLPDIAHQTYLEYRRQPNAAYVLALVGGNEAELNVEIEKASNGVPSAFEKGKEWKTTHGSYFTPRPLGETAQIAFVYPGAFNAYPGLGQDLFRHFPFLYDDFARQVADPGLVLNQKLLYSHTLEPQSAEVQEERLTDDHPGMMLCGTSFAILFTRLLRDYFKVKASKALGYSLGETSMLWSTGVWTEYNRGTDGFSSSPLFRTRLSGPKETIQELWNLTPEQAKEDFWSIYYVLAPVDKVKEALKDEPRVYLTHINAAEEVVIGGDSEGCRRVIAKLKCHHLRTTYSSVLHCEPVFNEYQEFVRFNTIPSHPVPDITLYSAADYEPLKLETQQIAETVSRMGCLPVDFPRLLERVYQDGARIFIELGPSNTCTRWSGKILKGKEHLAVNINQKGVKDDLSLLRLLAKLTSHRIGLDPGLLFGQTTQQAQPTTVLPNLYPERFAENAQLLAQAQATFLQGRQAGLGQISQLISQYMTALGDSAGAPPPPPTQKPPEPKPQVQPVPQVKAKPALFNQTQVEEFAHGSVVKCFGPEFLPYEGRRIARIPNTDLMLMTRVTSIEGARHNFEGVSTIVVDYDMPESPWFYEKNSYPYTPYSVHMEIALQPCGFLSAYKGSYFLFPDIDLFFRNLDGNATLSREIDLRGKTVTTTARMVASSNFEGTIIQRFEFETACEGEVYFKGASAFGFFSKEAMVKQVGLDGGKTIPAWLEVGNNGAQAVKLPLNSAEVRQNYFQAKPEQPHYRLPGKQLEFLDEVVVVPNGGKHGQGYIFATRAINPADWFYKCHFYQDPVMPGSLGIEGIIEAMQAFALQQNLGRDFKSPRFGMPGGHTVVWKYRGQIIPENKLMSLEMHLTKIEKSAQRVTITGDASLWKDGLRIYEIKQLALVIEEA